MRHVGRSIKCMTVKAKVQVKEIKKDKSSVYRCLTLSIPGGFTLWALVSQPWQPLREKKRSGPWLNNIQNLPPVAHCLPFFSVSWHARSVTTWTCNSSQQKQSRTAMAGNFTAEAEAISVEDDGECECVLLSVNRSINQPYGYSFSEYETSR